MITKRELQRRIETLEIKLEAQGEAQLSLMSSVRDLADDVQRLAEQTKEIARIIEEDFLPDDSEYRKMKESSDAMIQGFNNLFSYQGGAKAGGGEKP